PVGLGWSLSVPAIVRKTSTGIPRYDDATDTFILSGGEDLVPVGADGDVTWYRPRTEGMFASIAHRRDPTTDVWEVRGTDGVLSVYGTSGTAGADPAVRSHPQRRPAVFSWHLTRTAGPRGNAVACTYGGDRGRHAP